MVDARKKSTAIAIVTVHGTGDKAPKEDNNQPADDGDKWFQRGSVFATWLQTKLAARGIESEIVPHHWSAGNKASEREAGARKLAKTIRRHAKSHAGVHVVGHSHGGNVASDAATILGWDMTRKSPGIDSLTTVGTPFLQTNVSRSQRLGSWAFLALVAVSLALSVFCFLIVEDVLKARILPLEQNVVDVQEKLLAFEGEHGTGDTDAGSTRSLDAAAQRELNGLHYLLGVHVSERDKAIAQAAIMGPTLRAISLASILLLLFLAPPAFGGLRRVERVSRARRGGTELLAITHPEDEAIALLKYAESIEIEPFTRGTFLRASRGAAVLWGVRAVLIVPLVGAGLFIAGAVGLNDPSNALPWQDEAYIGGSVLLAVGVFGAPFVFGTAYATNRLIVGPFLEFVVRRPINSVVVNAIRGIALGRDGEHRVGNVSARAHSYGTKEYVLSGELAERIRKGAETSTLKLLVGYRAAIFGAGANVADGLGKLMADPTTWDGLIHTTYFDQEEVAELVADHIASAVVRRA